MNDHPDRFSFPEISDEAVIAINDFLELFYANFQSHYFAQIHRYYADLQDRTRDNGQTSLPLDDPPF